MMTAAGSRDEGEVVETSWKQEVCDGAVKLGLTRERAASRSSSWKIPSDPAESFKKVGVVWPLPSIIPRWEDVWTQI